MADGNITVTLQDLRGDEAKEQALWAERGRWLAEKLSERTTPDARTVLELVEEPIWARADGTFADYCAAIDAAMAADEDWWASERPPTPVGWSDTDWLRHLETCPPIGYALRDSLYGTSKAGVLRFCSSDEAGAFAVYASPRPTQTEPSPATPPQVPIPERLLDIIGRYGNARSGGCDEAEIIYRWEELVGAIKQYAATPPIAPLSEFKRMQIIGDEFPLALVEPIVIAKVDSVCRAIEKAHGIGA